MGTFSRKLRVTSATLVALGFCSFSVRAKLVDGPSTLDVSDCRRMTLDVESYRRIVDKGGHNPLRLVFKGASALACLQELEIPEGLGGYQVEAADGSQVVTLTPTGERIIDGRQRRVGGGVLDEEHSAQRYGEGYTPRSEEALTQRLLQDNSSASNGDGGYDSSEASTSQTSGEDGRNSNSTATDVSSTMETGDSNPTTTAVSSTMETGDSNSTTTAVSSTMETGDSSPTTSTVSSTMETGDSSPTTSTVSSDDTTKTLMEEEEDVYVEYEEGLNDDDKTLMEEEEDVYEEYKEKIYGDGGSGRTTVGTQTYYSSSDDTTKTLIEEEEEVYVEYEEGLNDDDETLIEEEEDVYEEYEEKIYGEGDGSYETDSSVYAGYEDDYTGGSNGAHEADVAALDKEDEKDPSVDDNGLMLKVAIGVMVLVALVAGSVWTIRRRRTIQLRGDFRNVPHRGLGRPDDI